MEDLSIVSGEIGGILSVLPKTKKKREKISLDYFHRTQLAPQPIHTKIWKTLLLQNDLFKVTLVYSLVQAVMDTVIWL